MYHNIIEPEITVDMVPALNNKSLMRSSKFSKKSVEGTIKTLSKNEDVVTMLLNCPDSIKSTKNI